jgi:hypothetical protein
MIKFDYLISSTHERAMERADEEEERRAEKWYWRTS